nr:MAG TPA: hypothetical protein [Caudoviricetes sp.]
MSSRDHQIYIHSHYVLSLGLRLCNYCCHSFIIQRSFIFLGVSN